MVWLASGTLCQAGSKLKNGNWPCGGELIVAVCKVAYPFAGICIHYSQFDFNFYNKAKFELALGVCEKQRPGVTTPTTPRPIAGWFICEDGWTEYSFYCYKLTERRCTWDDCESECERMNSTFASIHSKSQNDLVVSLAIKKKEGWVWIGAKREDELPKKIRWTDGSPLDFTHWNSGEPSYLNGLVGENCVEMTIHNGKWNDIGW